MALKDKERVDSELSLRNASLVQAQAVADAKVLAGIAAQEKLLEKHRLEKLQWEVFRIITPLNSRH